MRLHALGFHQLPPHQQVELLIGAAEFDVGAHLHRIPALHQRVEELVYRNRLVIPVTLREIVALEHTRDRVPRGEPNHVGGGFRSVPGRVETNLGRLGVEDLENLLLIGLRVLPNLLGCQRRTGRRLAAGVTDHAGKIADQEHDMVAELLELPHLVDQHGMTEV